MGPLKERDIEGALVRRVKELGGEVRKVQWIGRRGAPDRLVMLPPSGPARRPRSPAQTIWVELKAPGRLCDEHQLREHVRMRKMGQRVMVIDHIDSIDALFPLWLKAEK
jgi:hypothetical protein